MADEIPSENCGQSRTEVPGMRSPDPGGYPLIITCNIRLASQQFFLLLNIDDPVLPSPVINISKQKPMDLTQARRGEIREPTLIEQHHIMGGTVGLTRSSTFSSRMSSLFFRTGYLHINRISHGAVPALPFSGAKPAVRLSSAHRSILPPGPILARKHPAYELIRGRPRSRWMASAVLPRRSATDLSRFVGPEITS